jgi:hypothetical protein
MIFRDRPDGKALKVPNFKKLNPYMFISRDESALYCTDRFDMDEAINMLLALNRGKQPEERINLFHVILTSLLRTIVERPILNTFVAGQRYYKRNEIIFSFVAKKSLTDEGEESIVKISFQPSDSLQDVARKIREAVAHGKSEAGNKTEKEIDIVMALPRLFIKAFIWSYKFLDYNNLLPGFMIKTDPIYSTAFFTNLGSIGMDSVYHHLYNWGTCSIFISVGKLKKGPIYEARSGIVKMSNVMDMKMTLDDRVADGVYFGNSLRMFKNFIEHPEQLLEQGKYSKEQLDELDLKA